MTEKIDNPERWLKLAAETRAVAATMTDGFSKRTLILIAQRYEILAERSRRRAQEGKSLKSA